MKLKYLKYGLVFFLLCFLFVNKAHSQRYENKTKVIGLGFGPAVKYGNDAANRPTWGAKFSFDKGFVDLYPGTILIGIHAAFSRMRHVTPDSVTLYGYPAYTAVWSHYVVSFRGAYYHNGIRWGLDHLHVYGGASFGGRLTKFVDKFYTDVYPQLMKPANDGFKFHFSVFAGASYHITKNLAAMIEGGYSETWLTIGVMYTLGGKRLLPKIF